MYTSTLCGSIVKVTLRTLKLYILVSPLLYQVTENFIIHPVILSVFPFFQPPKPCLFLHSQLKFQKHICKTR